MPVKKKNYHSSSYRAKQGIMYCKVPALDSIFVMSM